MLRGHGAAWTRCELTSSGTSLCASLWAPLVLQAACERALEQSNARAELAEMKCASVAAAMESLRTEHAAATAQAMMM